MRITIQLLVGACIFFVHLFSQGQTTDVADAALISAFQRDSSKLVCSTTGGSLKEMRDRLNPYISGIDASKDSSYPALALAVYTAFPCPFSPVRDELKPATKGDLVGTWLMPASSGKLRHAPRSNAWSASSGVPPIKCEGVSFYESGEYRVMQVRGNFECPTTEKMQSMHNMPLVQSWEMLPNSRFKISRTDVASHVEEWDVYSVKTTFELLGVTFSAGDLVAYLRRERGNEINAASTFRHLTSLK